MPIVTIQVTREGTTPGATPWSSIGLVSRIAVPLGLTIVKTAQGEASSDG
jgi:hypothetical protein